jgi:hypothetical protein
VIELLIHDLMVTRKGTPIVQSGRHTSSILTIPEKLYGRDFELKSMMTAFERVSFVSLILVLFVITSLTTLMGGTSTMGR